MNLNSKSLNNITTKHKLSRGNPLQYHNNIHPSVHITVVSKI